MITIIKNKEPIYDTDNFDVVLMGVSTHNILMGNFQGKMGIKYPVVEEANNSTPYGDLRKLGKRVTIEDNKPIISLMYICTYPSRKDNFIDYQALENCLKTANVEFKGKKVLTTLLGSTKFDGKGDRDKCLKIIEECTKDLDLYVYDFEPITIKEEIKRQNKYFNGIKAQYKGNKEMLDKIKKMSMEMRKKTFLPTDLYVKTKKNKEDDEILNF
jgi:hypothetical protein